MSEAEVLSTDDLRSRLFETLKNRGYVDALKASTGVGVSMLRMVSIRLLRPPLKCRFSVEHFVVFSYLAVTYFAGSCLYLP